MMKVVIAYLHPGEVSHSFHKSLMDYLMHDLAHHRRLAGLLIEECGTSRVIEGRNSAARKFMRSGADWLLFIDSDMGFDPDAIDRLIDSADPEQRPLVGGLCFGQRKGPEGPGNTRQLSPVPTVYQWVDAPEQAGFAPMYDYPRDQMVACDGTGAAFLLIHRSVLAKIAETFPTPREWFDDTIYKGEVFGEDLTFCLRAKEAGFPLYVNTSVKVSHRKVAYLDESNVGDLTDLPTFVVIPMKNRMDLTRNLINQLGEQGQHERIFIFDNGSNRKTKNELATLGRRDVEVFDAEGMNIHQMWNRGLEEASKRAWQSNVAILNNDLNIGPDFLDGLSKALRSDPLLAAVCPNYDGRDGDDIEYVSDICAGRYDGTGGLAGFAFMLGSDSGYRFPEHFEWYCGDSDLMATIAFAGSKAGIVIGTTVEHVDGGSQTGDWTSPEMQRVLAADRAALEEKWKPYIAEAV